MAKEGARGKIITQAAGKRRLSDAALRSLAKHRAPDGQRVFVRDALVPGLAVMVTDTGALSYVLETRIPSPKTGKIGFARITAGKVGTLGLAAAREKAKEWLKIAAQGKDPRQVQREAREADAAERAVTFALVADDFLRRHLKGQRKGAVVKREIEKELIPILGTKPITRITRTDIVKLLEAIKDRRDGSTGAYARNIFGHAKKLFNWAINRGTYGLEHSPLDRLHPSDLLGKKREREVVLDDDQLRALWAAAIREGYPYGSLIQLLMLSGTRLSEAAQARHREFSRAQWNVPPERFKMDSVHTVPMTGDLREFYQALPQFKDAKEDFLFTLDGEIPFNGFGRAKRRLDRYMTWKWRALARLHGQDRRKVPLPKWQHHDIKRTVRTRLGALGVREIVAELIAGILRELSSCRGHVKRRTRAFIGWVADRIDACWMPSVG